MVEADLERAEERAELGEKYVFRLFFFFLNCCVSVSCFFFVIFPQNVFFTDIHIYIYLYKGA